MRDSKGYRKLLIWTKFKELLLFTYQLTNKLPPSEDFNLKSQIKRAIVSVLSNFVEGYLKGSRKEKLHYLEMSNTSLLEVAAQAEMCFILGYWTEEIYVQYEQKITEASFFLYRYTNSVKEYKSQYL